MKTQLLILAGFALIAFFRGDCAASANEHNEREPAKVVAQQPSKLLDGIYIVEQKSADKHALPVAAPSKVILPDDGRFLAPEERDPVQYVVIDTTRFVPFAFDSKPIEGHEPGTGKPMLNLQFAAKQATALEALTAKNVGGTVAIVVDGQIVTCHKIREAIRGGKLQITRCTKVGCDLIYSRLIQDKR